MANQNQKYIKDFSYSNKYNPILKGRNIENTMRYMLGRTNMMFDYEGLPDTIPKDKAELYMQTRGAVTITDKYDGKNLYAYTGGLGGEPNEYYMPTISTVANPAQKFNESLKIGEDCIVIYNDPLHMGLIPLLEKYVYLLAENELSIRLVEINTRCQSIITADKKNKKQAADEFIKRLYDGEIESILDVGLEEGIKTLPLHQTGHSNNITQLIELEQFLKGSMYNELGLQANFNMKRESLNDGEIAVNEPVLKPLLYAMLEERQKGWDAVNKKYGTNVKVKISDIWKGGYNNESKRVKPDIPADERTME